MDFKITANIQTGQLDALATKQLPFAIALALTKTAQDAQQDMRAALPGIFHLKNKWTQQQIRIVSATKASMQASITAPDYLAKQIAGGTQHPQRGAHIAIPGAPLLGRLIGRGSRPRNLQGAFKMRISGGMALAQRRGKVLRMMYWLDPTQDVRAVFDMQGIVQASVDRNIQLRFNSALMQAISTAR